MTKPKSKLEEIQELAEQGKIVMASQDEVNELDEYITQVLEVIGHPEAWVSDESMIGDFFSYHSINGIEVRVCGPDKKTIEQVGEELGLSNLKTKDYVVGVARLLSNKKAN